MTEADIIKEWLRRGPDNGHLEFAMFKCLERGVHLKWWTAQVGRNRNGGDSADWLRAQHEHAVGSEADDAPTPRSKPMTNQTPSAELAGDNAGLAALLREARLQLEYLDERFPTGTTPAVIARIDTYLATTREPALDLHTLEEAAKVAREVAEKHQADCQAATDARASGSALGKQQVALEIARGIAALKGGAQ